MKVRILVFAAILGVLFACNDRPSAPADTMTIEQKPFVEDENFDRTDSVELLFYPDPDQQKDYRFTRSTDRGLISSLVRDLKAAPVTKSACAHYKKLYLFEDGDVFKTIYVSDTCRYLAYAVNGEQQFRPLSEETLKLLEEEFDSIETDAP
jgi:hypothetical protein